MIRPSLPMRGRPRLRWIGRWTDSRVDDGARGRSLDRRRAATRRGPGTDVRLPRVAPSRHRHGLSHVAIRSDPNRRRAIGCTALYSGWVARVTKASRASRLEGGSVQARDPRSGRPPDRPTGRPAFGVGPIARVTQSPLAARPVPAPAQAPTNGAGRFPRRSRSPPASCPSASGCRTCAATSARTST